MLTDSNPMGVRQDFTLPSSKQNNKTKQKYNYYSDSGWARGLGNQKKPRGIRLVIWVKKGRKSDWNSKTIDYSEENSAFGWKI